MDGMDRTEKAGRENREEERLELALQTLRSFLLGLAARAGEGEEYGERLWQGIRQSAGLLQELAYYHDRGEFLCRYEVAGYTLADVLVWQVDHFRQPRLLLASFDTMLQMEEDPASFAEKMRCETGQDIL